MDSSLNKQRGHFIRIFGLNYHRCFEPIRFGLFGTRLCEEVHANLESQKTVDGDSLVVCFLSLLCV